MPSITRNLALTAVITARLYADLDVTDAAAVKALVARGVDVADRGNLPGPGNPWMGPVGGYRHLDEVVAWNSAVPSAMAELVRSRHPEAVPRGEAMRYVFP